MGKQRSSFAKLQRDRAKAAKKAEKQAARQGKGPDGVDVADLTVIDEEVEEVEEGTSLVASLVAGKGVLSAPELLALIEVVHSKLESGEIDHDEFEDAKVEIFARLPMD